VFFFQINLFNHTYYMYISQAVMDQGIITFELADCIFYAYQGK